MTEVVTLTEPTTVLHVTGTDSTLVGTEQATAVVTVDQPSVIILVEPSPTAVVIAMEGPAGPAGPPGSGSGSANLFVQQTNPGMTSPGEWWQTDGAGNLVTLWVEVGA